MKTLSFIVQWALRLFISYYLLQYSYVKLSGRQSAVDLFTTLGMESWGRIAMGLVEFIVVLLVLFPRTTAFGSILGMGSMGVVIFYHLSKLGIAMNGDSFLFIIACAIFAASLVLLILNRKQLVNTIFSI